ncbi:hypothetical protein C8R48DRAFT_778204 [Suillus tomentosus]|nr:hypothetical protein C8R48DRAFT_778204 [Suillus tomentosus]
MSATPPPRSHDAMLVDVSPACLEPGEHAPTQRSTRAGRGRPGRARRGRGGCYPPPRRPNDDVDALGAFTRFFRAEAQASEHPIADFHHARAHPISHYPEELATRKESHAFDQELRAERARELRCHAHRSRNLTLDHRTSASGPPSHYTRPDYHPRERPAHNQRPRPTTAAQVIAEVTTNAATILAPTPARVALTTDPGPDVEEIIAAAEQLDLEQASRMPDVTTEDIFAAFASLGPTREN